MKTIRIFVVVLTVSAVFLITGTTKSQAEVSVYDGDGQYLGTLLYNGVDGIAVQILIPSYEKTAILTHDGNFYGDYLYFENTDCTGPAYIYYRLSRNRLIKNQDNFYFHESAEPANVQLNSVLPRRGSCIGITSHNLEVAPAQEALLSFETPVATPLSFVYEAIQPGIEE